ncbi:MAG: hypothetical protein AB1486_06855 [Planctomycetota bacterium]
MTVRSGSNEEVSLEAMLLIDVRARIYRPDGSEWLPPDPVLGDKGWEYSPDPNPPRAVLDPRQVTAFGGPFPSGFLGTRTVWPDGSDPAQRPTSHYVLQLLCGQTYTIRIEGDDLGSATETLTVTDETREIEFRL